MESHKAIHEFMKVHVIKSDSYGNLHFEALVEYRSPARNATEITNIKIIRNGYQDGEISLDEAGVFSANDYHLDFTTDFQDYVFSEDDNKLTINGSSPKMGGQYSISIHPV